MTKFKVGDRVKIKEDLNCQMNKRFGLTPDMELLRGMTATIISVLGEVYKIDLDSGCYNWESSVFEEATKPMSKIDMLYVINNIQDGEIYTSVEDKDRRIERRGDTIATFSMNNKLELKELFNKLEVLTLNEVVKEENIGCKFKILEDGDIWEVDRELDIVNEDNNELSQYYTLGEILNFRFIKQQ